MRSALQLSLTSFNLFLYNAKMLFLITAKMALSFLFSREFQTNVLKKTGFLNRIHPLSHDTLTFLNEWYETVIKGIFYYTIIQCEENCT